MAKVKDSNEAEVLAILEALRIYLPSFNERLAAERDSSACISRVSSTEWGSLKIHFYLNKFIFLSSSNQIAFRHVG